MVKKENLLKFKGLLLKEKERIVEKSKEVVSEDLIKQNNKPGDEADISSSTFDQSLTIRLLSREARLLKKIEKTLKKIECGNYGICEVCGKKIDLKRLKTRLVADLCIKCKEDREQREKMRLE
jgi:DnaK suppressor protein